MNFRRLPSCRTALPRKAKASARLPVGALFLFVLGSVTAGELRLARPFNHHAVLQRECTLPIFGTDKPGTSIRVSLANLTRTTTADAEGRWHVRFPPQPASLAPLTLIADGTGTVTATNVVIGDVWLISGQSNADWPLRSATGGSAAIAAATNRLLRYLPMDESPVTTPPAWSAAHLAQLKPGRFFSGEWQASSPTTAGAVSAIGYFFAQHLATNRAVPIGLIDCAVGGTPTESWIPDAAIAANPRLAAMRSNHLNSPMVAAFVKKRIRQNLAAWEQSGGPSPMPDHPYLPGACWRLGLAEIAPYAIRGVLWYQGESNADFYEPVEFDNMAAWHTDAFKSLVAGWRHAWGNDQLPFFTVQLPLMNRPAWPWFRESQAACAETIPHCALAVAYDLGTSDDVHPPDKLPVAERLALLARALSYGEKIECQGPALRQWHVRDAVAIVTFDHVGGGLISRDDLPLRHFELAGADRIFHPATVTINGDTLRLVATNVSVPVAVRYAWSPTGDLNFFNRAGLPAPPFRTDRWPATNPHQKL